MKKLLIALIALPLTVFAHSWPNPPVDEVQGLLTAGFCFNVNNCSFGVMQGRAQYAAEQHYCLSSGRCAPPNGTYIEVHVGEYWYSGALQGRFRRENHFLFVMVKNWPTQGQDYFQPAGYHVGACQDHHYSPQLGQ